MGNAIDYESLAMKKERIRKTELTREKQRLIWEEIIYEVKSFFSIIKWSFIIIK